VIAHERERINVKTCFELLMVLVEDHVYASDIFGFCVSLFLVGQLFKARATV
jgi:hypothetical protein